MPSIIKHINTNSTKILLLGDQGTGKTGALVSLVLAGYKVRLLDLDNGRDIIYNYLVRPESPYAKELKAKNINLDEAFHYYPISERMKTINGRTVPAAATVWTKTMSMLEKWKDEELDFGAPRDWDNNTVLVVDSLTALGQAALNSVQALNGRLGSVEINYDTQRDTYQAQTLIERFLQLLYDDNFRPNVVVIAHLLWKNPDGTDRNDNSIARKGYPRSVGQANASQLGKYFNNVFQTISVGSGTGTRYRIATIPQPQVNLKSSAPFLLEKEYPVETGLGSIFTTLRGK